MFSWPLLHLIGLIIFPYVYGLNTPSFIEIVFDYVTSKG